MLRMEEEILKGGQLGNARGGPREKLRGSREFKARIDDVSLVKRHVFTAMFETQRIKSDPCQISVMIMVTFSET